uniref:C2H2-type domain-containing protein n=1 Tax=Caenorhabditis japonica TaxID=281687 RepID=A0A8R1DL82_CAEJA
MHSHFQDCQKCLLLFCDIVLYRMHMSMHGRTAATTWKCTMCDRQFSDRRQFQQHIVTFEHSLIPPGVTVPKTPEFQSGLPDLASLCPPSELSLLDEITKSLSGGK